MPVLASLRFEQTADLINRLSRHWLIHRGHYDRALAFSSFIAVHTYDDAYAHLCALEAHAGDRWWPGGPHKPWQPLSDIGKLYEARKQPERALDTYDCAIEALETRRTSLSRDEFKVTLASDKGAQYLYFLAARAAVRANK